HGDRVLWVAAERRSLAATVWPGARFEPNVAEPPARRAPAWTDREGALVEVIRARLGLVGPTTAPTLAEDLDVTPGEVDAALAAGTSGYQPGWVDELCRSGEVTWGRLGLHESARHAGRRLSAAVPLALLLRRDLPWLLDPRPEPGALATATSGKPSGPALDVL